MEEFTNRRNKLITQLADNSVAIIPAAKIQYRNSQTEYPFRQNSNFYYLTGYDEQDAICVLIKDTNSNSNKFILFVLPEVQEEKNWSGLRIGQDQAKSVYKADESYSLADAEAIIPQLLKNKHTVYFAIGNDPEWDSRIISWVKLAGTKITKKARANGEQIDYIPSVLQDIAPVIAELRLYKSEQEIKQLRTAAEIASQGHAELMRCCKAGLYEYQLEAIFVNHCMQHGCRALAYQATVASGKNACTLHYSQNTRQLQDGDLVVIDAGGEYNYYASDITRTLPVNGKFNAQQKAIYNLVLQAQLAGLTEIKPGNIFSKVQEIVVKTLVAGLVELGILQGNLTTLIQEQTYKKYYMHNAGHWLGLDVHDAGEYYKEGKSRLFAPGMVLTIEPGLYIAADAFEVAEQWRGIGVRIEDMVLVTPNGHEVLTTKLPKTIVSIETAMSSESN